MSDTLKIANSIWHNGMKVDSDGHPVFYPLGTKKVKVPTSSSEWPKGNKLVSPFVYQDDKLVGFVDTKSLITKSQTTIYLPYTHIEADFSAIDKGKLQIHAPKATTKKASWKNSGTEDIPVVQYKYKGCKTVDDVNFVTYDYLADIANGIWSEPLWDLTNGYDMFYNCGNLNSFTSDLPNLTNATWMFFGCGNLNSFKSDLSSLTDSSSMFYECTALTSFTSNLPSLTDGNGMFYKTNLNSFNYDLPSLTDGYGMFSYCENLNSFKSDLSSLTNGNYMFQNCINLPTFSSDLSSLTDGRYMFQNCKLDAPSVANIIHFIPQRDAKPTSTSDDGNITIGIGITNTDAAKQAFAEECDCTDWADLNKEFDDKKWAVQWQFNGEATTFDIRAERPSTAVYAKLEEVFMPTEEEIAAAKEKGERIEIPHYEYVSQDGDNYYNIHWYHDSNTNNEGYDYFESLEMATLAYSVIPKD